MARYLLALCLLALLSCAGRKPERYPRRPSFSQPGGPAVWEVYLSESLTPQEVPLIREAVRDHLSALGGFLTSPKPAWQLGRPRIYVTSSRVRFLSGSARANQASRLGPGEAVTVTPGHKLTCPALLVGCLALRWDDPWGASPHANYSGASTRAAAIVLALELRR